MKEIVRAHLYVSGIVQGVFFRANTHDVARFLDLTGYVKNLPDGRVDVVAEGPKDKVEQLINWCYKGPPGASVNNVEIYWESATGEFKNFAIQYRF